MKLCAVKSVSTIVVYKLNGRYVLRKFYHSRKEKSPFVGYIPPSRAFSLFTEWNKWRYEFNLCGKFMVRHLILTEKKSDLNSIARIVPSAFANWNHNNTRSYTMKQICDRKSYPNSGWYKYRWQLWLFVCLHRNKHYLFRSLCASHHFVQFLFSCSSFCSFSLYDLSSCHFYFSIWIDALYKQINTVCHIHVWKKKNIQIQGV